MPSQHFYQHNNIDHNYSSSNNLFYMPITHHNNTSTNTTTLTITIQVVTIYFLNANHTPSQHVYQHNNIDHNHSSSNNLFYMPSQHFYQHNNIDHNYSSSNNLFYMPITHHNNTSTNTTTLTITIQVVTIYFTCQSHTITTRLPTQQH